MGRRSQVFRDFPKLLENIPEIRRGQAEALALS
jgi:hypothetical protein